VQYVQVYLKQLNTYWIAFIKLGEIINTNDVMVFDEENLDQEWSRSWSRLSVCVCKYSPNHEHASWTIGMGFKGLLRTNHIKL